MFSMFYEKNLSIKNIKNLKNLRFRQFIIHLFYKGNFTKNIKYFLLERSRQNDKHFLI